MNTGNKVLRIWRHIEFSQNWKDCDTSSLDDIAASWFARRSTLQANSIDFKEFIERLKREHAIETGIIERLYSLSTGVTEKLIKEGFYSNLVSHGDTDVPTPVLMNHLNDHLEAVDFIFDTVINERPLSVSFIKQVHQLVTRHQESAEGRDQFGNKLKIPLLKGAFKIRENNPTRADGTLILYCPPEHVEAEMDNLVQILGKLENDNIHPLIIAAWVHHAFITIHPFQDGNGRVSRLLTSLILIKAGFFPFTVLREEVKVRYFKSLELADDGKPGDFVAYLSKTQIRSIERILNIREVSFIS
ncbi:MAG: Fic family protein [Bacteroidota bacterium]